MPLLPVLRLLLCMLPVVRHGRVLLSPMWLLWHQVLLPGVLHLEEVSARVRARISSDTTGVGGVESNLSESAIEGDKASVCAWGVW